MIILEVLEGQTVEGDAKWKDNQLCCNMHAVALEQRTQRDM